MLNDIVKTAIGVISLGCLFGVLLANLFGRIREAPAWSFELAVTVFVIVAIAAFAKPKEK